MTSRIEGESVSSMTRRSMPMPQPPVGGRQAVFEGADVVGIEVHGLFVTGFLGLDLGAETRHLVFSVVELGEAIGDLAAYDEQLEALGDLGIGVRCTRQRRDFDRVVDDEGRLP